jgi:probable addiction module antidote protein/putative addiction module killer protein
VIEIRRYTAAEGRDVFGEWLANLADLKARARIAVRIDRLAGGNFGDSKSIGEGLHELRIDWRPGYRVYYGDNRNGLRAALVRRGQTQTVCGYQESAGILEGLQEKDGVGMKRKPGISHDQAMAKELRENPEFAVEYLRAALEEGDDPRILLIALRRIAESRGGVAKVAKEAGIERESLYRALSAKGNPRLSTLVAVIKAVGLRLTVEMAH